MKIYLSSIQPRVIDKYLEIFPAAKLNVLISYAYINNTFPEYYGRLKQHISSLILDSGAFTLNNLKENATTKVTIERYKDYLEFFGRYYDYVFSFDRHFHKEGLKENVAYHERLRGAHPRIVPVIHDFFGGDAETYIQMPDPIVAIGFSDDKRRKENVAWITRKLHEAGKMVHALGISNYARLATNPIALCDSSSWTQPGQFNKLQIWLESNAGDDKTENIYFEDHAQTRSQNDPNQVYTTHKKKDEIVSHIENLGMKYEDLLYSTNMDNRLVVQIHYFQTLQDVVTSNHLDRGWSFPT